jgi:hypothetical protein
MDRGRDVRFVFCDVSKAFDKVSLFGIKAFFSNLS